MHLKDLYQNEIKNIKIKTCRPDSLTNSQEYLNSEKTFSGYLDYDADEYFSFSKIKNWPAEIESKIPQLKPYLHGDILELGAGNCKTSAFISKLPEVTSLTCVEFSQTMLFEVAPRVILHFGGRLDKFRFIAGDMNRSENFNDRKYDAIVFQSALHHVFLPFFQVEKWYEMLKPGGAVICINEPGLADFYLPTTDNRNWINGQIAHQRLGNNENYYRASDFQAFFTKFGKFDFAFLDTSLKFSRRLLEKIKRLVWHKRISLSFVAIKK
jgi:SAM-dependent methyltransferase